MHACLNHLLLTSTPPLFSSPLPQNTTHKHLRRALTESLGCIAVGALIQSLVQAIRGLCENRVLRCIMRVIESYVNWLTTYALLYAGMTGACIECMLSGRVLSVYVLSGCTCGDNVQVV